MEVVISKEKPALAAVLTCEILKSLKQDVSWTLGQSNSLTVNKTSSFTSSASISRFLSRSFPSSSLYGLDILKKTEVDTWLNFAYGKLACTTNFSQSLNYLESVLRSSTYLVGDGLTLADFAIWEVLRLSSQWQALFTSKDAPTNALRYYNFLSAQAIFSKVASKFPAAQPKELNKKPADPSARNEEGKFVELPGAEIGKVVVRFPPEASGYLHVGHAKAALLNQHYRDAFQGKLIMRFDDTNPAKEDADFEQVILKDLAMLGVKYDILSHTSDHFDKMLELCEKMIKDGKAFVDDTDAETMKKEREERADSKNRNNDVKTNLKLWEEMKKGSTRGLQCCVRAKISMKSDNGTMRDPTIYRCKTEEHVKTGTKYKTYPTYDFACPIVDSVENVTHALRTTEYHDRDEQYYWLLEALGLRKPHIYEYSRLNLRNTVMSKRKLTWFVNEGLVEGWDDPRFPTVRGVMRRGMTVEGLKQFIISQGSSRAINVMEWDKIWAFNKKVIDPVVPRYTALSETGSVLVNVAGAKTESKLVAKHPKNTEVGEKTVWYGPRVFIDGADATELSKGEIVTFINWGNLIIVNISKDEDGKITSIDAELNLDNTDYKKTQKLTWLADVQPAPLIPAVCIQYDHIISASTVGKDEDFKQFINPNSKQEEIMLGDPCLASLKKGDMIQLQRRGYYICDQPYEPTSVHTGRDSPCVLLNIPDGHQKEMPKAGSKHKETKESKESSSKEKAQSKKGKASEKSPQDEQAPSSVTGASITDLDKKISAQGDKVRQLKTDKAPKNKVDEEVKTLLSLKAEFKSQTGKDWKPGQVSASPATKSAPTDNKASELNDAITKQGNKVRDLKAAKANKTEIDAEVKTLLSIKAEFKSATGQDWKPGMTVPSSTTAAAWPPSSGGSSVAGDLNDKITQQGNKVRDLKAANANKAEIDAEVKTLLSLKAEFKSATGQDWKPGMTVPSTTTTAESLPSSGDSSLAGDLNDKITKQGNKVRDLKAAKANKTEIDAEVKTLLSLKAEFKSATGQDWKPGMTVPSTTTAAASPPSSGGSSEAGDLNDKITQQGNKVRDLKAAKASKTEIDAEVKTLLSLKAEFKSATGQDWKPGMTVPSSTTTTAAASSPSSVAGDLNDKITQQGNKVRDLKAAKASKSEIDAEVKTLLSLKAEYKTATGSDWKPAMSAAGNKVSPQKAAAKLDKTKKDEQAKVKKGGGDGEPKDDPKREVKKVTRLGLEALKEEHLSDWYTQVITKSEMIEYYDVSGCYILRPWAYSIWELIKAQFDTAIKDMGVENCYFPMFVSHSALEREKTHIEDFAPEVAWVTKSGQSELAEPIAIRPTSETVMYPSYAKWVKSHRDLPIRLNQWCNVVRWEFKHPQPFLRTREFLWQEGHTAWADQKSAEDEVYAILEEYARVYEELLAIPVVRGRKTEKEKFAGGDFTTTVEAYIEASGRAIQGATSHHLGQNFSKMFDIVFDDPDTQQKQYVFQNSWGLTTRTIGVLVMVHGDNMGLVLPPRCATLQTVIVPCGITATTKKNDAQTLYDKCEQLNKELTAAGIRSKADTRDNHSPGWKFNHWELKGVSLRIELGPRDMKNNEVVVARRDTGVKKTVAMQGLVSALKEEMETMQADMYARAKAGMDKHIVVCYDWNQFCDGLDKKNLIQAPFCGAIPCEDKIKKDSARDVVVEEGAPAMGAKGLCIPFKPLEPLKAGAKCICPNCDEPAKYITMFGRSY